MLDPGFVKALTKVLPWFEGVSKSPAFLSAFGQVKINPTTIKPSNLVHRDLPKPAKKEEKPKEAEVPQMSN